MSRRFCVNTTFCTMLNTRIHTTMKGINDKTNKTFRSRFQKLYSTDEINVNEKQKMLRIVSQCTITVLESNTPVSSTKHKQSKVCKTYKYKQVKNKHFLTLCICHLRSNKNSIPSWKAHKTLATLINQNLVSPKLFIQKRF